MGYLPLLKYVNVNSKFIAEDMQYDEEEPDIPNPLPVPPPAKLAVILNTIDDIESEYIEKAYKEKFGEFDPKKPHQWGQSAHYIRRQLGKIQEVPISKLTAIEPKLYGKHLVRLAGGYEPTRGDKLPIVYILKSGMYLGDGNHRVVNELSKGKTTVTALVLDFRKEEQELE